MESSTDIIIFILSILCLLICLILFIYLIWNFWCNSWRGYTFNPLKIAAAFTFCIFIATILVINIQTIMPKEDLVDITYIEGILFGITRMCIYGFFIVKLYDDLSNTLYQVSMRTYCLLSTICILCGCLFTLFYLDLWSLQFTIITGSFYILFDFILLIFLFYLYIRKLIDILMDQISSDIVNKSTDISNQRDLKKLHLTQRKILNSIISLYLLSSIAIISHLFWEIAEISRFATNDHHIALVINQVIGLINIIIDSFCIYISFEFHEYIYDKLFVNIHEFVQKKAQQFAEAQVLK